MKRIYILIIAMLALPAMSQPFYTESFEGMSTYHFPNGNGIGSSNEDFFDRTDSAGAPPQEVFNYTGFDGNYFIAAEDIDGVLSSSIAQVLIQNIDISGRSNLSITASFASGTNIDIDESGDSIAVQIKVDSSNWMTIGKFEVDSSTYSSSTSSINGQFAEDTDGDGYGDGNRLNGTFTDFTWSIPLTGDSLDIRIIVDLNSGDEEAAFDNVRVNGSLISNLESFHRKKKLVSIYPNPASEEVFVSAKSAELELIEIIDLKGRLIQSINASGETEKITIGSLEKGMYVFRVHTNLGVEHLMLHVL